jgi:ribose 5-phosphate isomerase A
LAATRRAIEEVTGRGPNAPSLRLRKGHDGLAIVTDGGHWIIDAQLGRIPDPPQLAQRLASIPGVVEHGLFIGLAQAAILAGPGGVRVVERP